nr:thiolase family protein [Capillimicrobium parvum]
MIAPDQRMGSGGGGAPAAIVGAHETPYTRHPAEGRDTRSYLAEAVAGALADAGIEHAAVDGLGVSSFSLAPDHAIDLAWRLGLHVRWLMDDANGGAGALNMLGHAVRAIEAGDAETIVLVSGDHLDRAAFRTLVEQYNRATADELVPLGYAGPNALFAMLTQRYADEHGLTREDLACIPIAQRWWAGRNPGAVYREPLTLEDYLAAPYVAEPLTRYDCVPVVTGADAVVVSAAPARRRRGAAPHVRVRAVAALHNPDDQQGDGVHPGFAEVAARLWPVAGAGPGDVDAAFLYDDYPVMALVQAAELGLVPGGDLAGWLHRDLLERRWPLNTSGGQLSAGQAGAAGGMHGLVEAVHQLRGRAGERQTPASLALVAGYGMVLYRHGACHNAAVLERIG